MGERWAVMSDIHGNLAALEAVLSDAAAQGAEHVAVLGDVIDYGPDPVACLERVREAATVWLVGNHEEEVVTPDPDQEESDVLRWTQPLLAGSGAWEAVRAKIAADGADAHASRIVGDRHFVHASAASPTKQYIWPAHECQYVVFNHQIDERIAGFLGEFAAPHGFHGHTHVPAVLAHYADHEIFDFYQGAERHHIHTFVGPSTIFFVPRVPCTLRGLGDKRIAVNVGSVGQPRRLADNRASYVLTDGDALEFRRVPYAWEKTAAKLAKLPVDEEQKAELIERLEQGV